MKSYLHLLMPILRGRDHLNRRLAGLLLHHTTFVLLDLSGRDVPEEENVALIRDAASSAPKHVQRVIAVGPDHAVLLLAAGPKTARQAIDYATVLAGDRNYVFTENGKTRDRHGVAVPGSTLDADSLDLWAEHLGVRLRADRLYERSPSFLAYARALGLP